VSVSHLPPPVATQLGYSPLKTESETLRDVQANMNRNNPIFINFKMITCFKNHSSTLSLKIR